MTAARVTHDGDDNGAPAARSSSVLTRVLLWRLPLWSVLLLAFVGAATGLASWVLRGVPDLGPAIPSAEHVDAKVVLCNAVVDTKGINPRAAELALEREFEQLGAREANVRVTRKDCPVAETESLSR